MTDETTHDEHMQGSTEPIHEEHTLSVAHQPEETSEVLSTSSTNFGSVAEFQHASSSEAQGSTPSEEEDTAEGSESPSGAEASKSAPAATASSYRDIIAMRLAERAAKSGGGAAAGQSAGARPMAHTSEWREGKPVEHAQPAEPIASHTLPSLIESETKAQEIESPNQPTETTTRGSQREAKAQEAKGQEAKSTEGKGPEGMSARDRARQRQRERAELRSGGKRGARAFGDESLQSTSEPGSTEGEVLLHEEGSVEPEAFRAEERPEERPQPQREQGQREQRNDRREPRRQEGRPEREARPEREGRPEGRPEPRPELHPEDREREAREREERRQERVQRIEQSDRGQRGPRRGEPRPDEGQRPERVERRQPDRVQADRPEPRQLEPRQRLEPRTADRTVRSAEPVPEASLDLKGGVPKQSEQAFQRAKAMATKLGISVVIPLYNEQESLRELTAALRSQLFKLCGSRYQIIFVNDGSTDRSGDILRDILQVTSRVTVLSFRRNMGKSAALAVGFREVKCGIVITMDADLQDDPGEIPNLIAKLDEGYDLVSGWKKKRYDPITKTLPSKFFNSVTGFFAGVKLHDFNCGLKAYRKEVTDALDVYGELHRYLPALAHWKGFRVGEIPVVHHPRKFGKSKFGSSRFFKGFLDLLSIVFTNRYGKRPLHLFGTVGTLLALIGLGINITVTVEWAMNQTALSNRPILLLGILLILVGVQLISLGLLGEMVVKQTNRASDFTAIRERGSRLPEDQDRARRSTSGRMRSDRVSPDRLGRTDRPEGERMSREGRRPRNEGEEGSGGRRSDDAQRRMGRDRRRRPRP